MLSRVTAEWLHALPSHRILEDRFLLTHGGVRDIQQYMTRPRHFVENAGYLARDFPGVSLCFFGHTHEQRVFEVDGERVKEIDAAHGSRLHAERTYFVNPGSVDASRKRLAKRAEFAVFDSATLALHFEAVPYDDAVTEEKAERDGYRIDRWRDRLYDVQRRLVGPRHVENGAP
jgi:predicted phosphodiesterase